MANKYYIYEDECQNTHAILAEENVMALYSSIVKTKNTGAAGAQAAAQPQAFDSLEELQVEDNNAFLKPSGLTVRSLKLNIPGFGSAIMPVLKNGPVFANYGEGPGAYLGDFAITLQELEILAVTQGAWDNDLPISASTEGDLSVVCTGFEGEKRA